MGDSGALGQAQVVRELGLLHWMYLYSVVRHASASILPGLTRMERGGVPGSQEREV